MKPEFQIVMDFQDMIDASNREARGEPLRIVPYPTKLPRVGQWLVMDFSLVEHERWMGSLVVDVVDEYDEQLYPEKAMVGPVELGDHFAVIEYGGEDRLWVPVSDPQGRVARGGRVPSFTRPARR